MIDSLRIENDGVMTSPSVYPAATHLRLGRVVVIKVMIFTSSYESVSTDCAAASGKVSGG